MIHDMTTTLLQLINLPFTSLAFTVFIPGTKEIITVVDKQFVCRIKFLQCFDSYLIVP